MFTALIITLLVVAGAATAVGAGLALGRRQRALEGRPAPKALPGASMIERGLRELRVGDVVTYDGKDFLVEGVLGYDEDGHTWIGGKLTDGADARWMIIGIERLGQLQARMLTEDSQLELAGYPPETILAENKRYNLEKRGTATVRLSGEIGTLAGAKTTRPDTVERCRWWLYNGTDDDTLIVEQWGGEYRALRGKIAPADHLDLIPGS